ncbi:MAG: rhodanese-related sulfurtransferase [Lentisphaeraceae bacterium]|nr:rhodanese-related sulfurtransferase [Lentisphaeraceae bacterium]
MSDYVVCALYKFVRLENFEEMRQPLFEVMDANEVRGTLLLANEGLNGTISGSRQGIDTVLAWLNSDERINPISSKESYTDISPFKRSKVKLKKEIVTMGVEGIDPTKSVGTYIPPKEWNDLISDPDVVLVDTRNEYEYEIGTFQNAVNPHTDSFREFPKYVEDNLDPEKHKKVAMFCTGGIRCEKSTAFLKEKGFEEVYHLQGGILKYLEEVPKEETMWEGECFVFDDRVAVNHDLEKGKYDQCHACRFPITEEEKEDERYIQGVSCPRCHEKTSENQKQRYLEREKQIRLAEERGEAHIGHHVKDISEQKRIEKEVRKKEQQEKSQQK